MQTLGYIPSSSLNMRLTLVSSHFLNDAHVEIFCPKKEEMVTCQRLNGTTTRKMTTTFHGIFLINTMKE